MTFVETPVYDQLCATYGYSGQWAFDGKVCKCRAIDCGCATPWAEAWQELCAAPYAVGYHSYHDEFVKLRERLLKHWQEKDH